MRVTICLILLTALISGSASAEDIKFQFTGFRDIESAFSVHQEALDEYETRLTALESRPESWAASSGHYDACCHQHFGLYAGAALVIAKPHFEDEVDVGFDAASYDYEVTPRVWMGYRNDCGAGIRARYWVFDHASNEPAAVAQAPFSLNVRTADLEFTQVACVGPLVAEFFGGARYGKVEHLNNNGEGLDFEGIGPQVGVDLLIPTRSCISLYGGTRAAVLFGSTKYNANGSPGDADLMPVFELQLGAEYVRCLGGGLFAIRSGVEAQVWPSGVDEPANGIATSTRTDNSFGFLGYVFGAEFRR